MTLVEINLKLLHLLMNAVENINGVMIKIQQHLVVRKNIAFIVVQLNRSGQAL